MYKYHEIVKTVFLDEIIYKNNDHSDRYKIEIYKNSDNSYSSRLFRSVLFDMDVMVNGKENIRSTEDIYVQDAFFPILQEKTFSNIDDCLNFALSKIEEETKGYVEVE